MILAIAGVVLTVYVAVHVVNGVVDFAQGVFSGASSFLSGGITVEEVLVGVLIGFVVAYTIRKRRMNRKAEAEKEKVNSLRRDLSRAHADDGFESTGADVDYGRQVMNSGRQ